MRVTTTENAPESKTHSYELQIECHGVIQKKFIKIVAAKKLGLSMENPGPVDAWLYSNGDVSLK